MTERIREDERLRQYLLGQLAPADSDALENALIDDADLRAQVEAVERDLIDDYVCGTLTGNEKSGFEKLFFASARRREKITFAEALAEKASELRLDARHVVSRRPLWISRFVPGAHPAVGYALAAVLLLMIVGAGWFLLYQRRPAAEQAQQPSAPPAGTAPKNDQTEVAEVKPDISPSIPNSNAQPTESPRTQPQQRPRLIASFLILPGSLRGAEDGQQLVIPSETTSVRLRLSLADQPSTSAVRVELHRQAADGELVWKTGVVRARSSAEGPIISLEVPSSKLTDGSYAALIKTTDGRLEAVYSFTVARR